MAAQLVTILALMRGTFARAGVWSRVAHFVVVPLAAGIAVAFLLRQVVNRTTVCADPHWRCVGALYLFAASIILAAVVAVSQAGPFGATCRRDLRSIVFRFAPAKA
jgi:hypothetical protein